MSTFGVMKSRIARELVRSDIDTEIGEAINSAILQYENHGWWFDESISTTFSTVASQQAYTSSDSADIPKFVSIDEARVTISTGDLRQLVRLNFNDLSNRTTATNSTGQPQFYAYYGNSIHLYPIPSGVWTIRVSGKKRSTDLSATSDANGWMTHGELLIRSAAKKMLAAHVIREPAIMEMMAAAEAEALQALRTQNNYRQSTGAFYIKPDGFTT